MKFASECSAFHMLSDKIQLYFCNPFPLTNIHIHVGISARPGSSVGRVTAPGNERTRVRSRAVTYQNS